MSVAPGTAGLHVGKVRDRSTVLSCWSRSPLSLLTPCSSGDSVWAYSSSFGGGMVQGDTTSIALQVDPGARCFLGTQASTKVYRNPGALPCSHRFTTELAEDSLLVLAPDPIQCFAEASYRQVQTFDLATRANLVLVDWISAGRIARGERWSFTKYQSRNVVKRCGELIFLDSVLLEGAAHRYRAGRFNCFATIFILGPKLACAAVELLAAVQRTSISKSAELVVSASPIHDGAALRLAGTQVELVGRAVLQYLQFVPVLLEGNPWARKW